jgi:nucleotide-binding universal stress UspA family protein
VVGTDFSDPALPAIEAAFDEARRVDGRVTVVHSLDIRWLPTDGLGVPDSAATALRLDEMEAGAAEQLDQVLRSRDVQAERRVMREAPATALLRVAEETDADLVVVGTRGRTGLSRVLLGSVAEAVVRSAGCSVLVVRLHEGP